MNHLNFGPNDIFAERLLVDVLPLLTAFFDLVDFGMFGSSLFVLRAVEPRGALYGILKFFL